MMEAEKLLCYVKTTFGIATASVSFGIAGIVLMVASVFVDGFVMFVTGAVLNIICTVTGVWGSVRHERAKRELIKGGIYYGR